MKIDTVLATKGPSVFTVDPSAVIRNAAVILAENNIGALIVLDGGGAPVGILSERDIVRELPRQPGLLDKSVAELMTTGILTGSPQDDVQALLRTMTERHFRHLPIVESGKLIGMVTLGDLVRAQLNELEGEVETLTIQLMDN